MIYHLIPFACVLLVQVMGYFLYKKFVWITRVLTFILNTTLIFKEDLLGDVNINLNDIKYTTLDGYELSGNAKDSVNIYEKIMDEETEKNPDNVDNPDTMDIASIISFLILLTLFIGINNYRIKKELR